MAARVRFRADEPSRLTPTAAMASSTNPAARLDRSWKRPVGPRPTAVLRDGGSGRERASQSPGQEAGRDLAAGAGNSPPDRRPVRDLARNYLASVVPAKNNFQP